MKCEVKGWEDTLNVDIVLSGETDAETALLVILSRHNPAVVFRNGKLELIFRKADGHAE